MKFELSHDSLAKSIYDKASHQDKMLRKIQQFINDRRLYFEENNVLLSRRDLNYISPYTRRVFLSQAEKDLIQKSEARLKRNKRRLVISLAIVCMILAASIIYININAVELEKTRQDIKRQKEKIEAEEHKKELAERRADSLLQRKVRGKSIDIKDPRYAQTLINSYDTLQKANESIKEQRNIAQSATLSTLAEEALDQKDQSYAFKLASKAWKLNISNKQACDVLYEISDDASYENEIPRSANDSVRIQRIIDFERSRNGRGDLSKEDMNAIFEKENTVVTEKKEGVHNMVINIDQKKKKASQK